MMPIGFLFLMENETFLVIKARVMGISLNHVVESSTTAKAKVKVIQSNPFEVFFFLNHW